MAARVRRHGRRATLRGAGARVLPNGLISWHRTRSRVALYVGTAFGLFGLSHLATLLGLSDSLNVALIVSRTLAHLLVAYAMFVAA